MIVDDQETETYLDESIDELLRVPSTQDIAGDFAYSASFQRHTGEVQGLITDLRDKLQAQTDAWSEQLQQIPELQTQGTNHERISYGNIIAKRCLLWVGYGIGSSTLGQFSRLCDSTKKCGKSP